MIIYHDEIHKAPKDYSSIVQRMRAFLNPKEPMLVSQLVRFWKNQENALTYREIREAIRAGAIDEKTVDSWRQDYTKFITQHLLPLYQEAIGAGAEQLRRRYPDYLYDPHTVAIEQWTVNHSAEFIHSVTEEQRRSINTLIMRYSTKPDISVDALAHFIRPTIGLNAPQTTANANYYDRVKENLTKLNEGKTSGVMRTSTIDKQAQAAAARYSEKQHRYRAMMIARTELVSAYSMGANDASRDAYDKGLIGRYNKRWVTADDDRVCPWCKAMDGTEVGQDDEFATHYGGKVTSPMHPQCRCVVISVETEAPPLTFGES